LYTRLGEGLAAGARNKPVTDAFEAGSVMKVFSVAAALDAGAVTPDTMFDTAGGSITISNHTIKDVHPDGNLSVAGIIKRSSNVGAAKIAMRFGAENLYASLKRFGFGTRTGIEMPGEQHGMLRDGAKWREVELATISFGYGLTTTPLQIAAALAAIGNDGIYTTPHIVEKVTDADGNTVWAPPSESHPIMKPATAAAMRTMLAGVFDRDDKTGHGGGTAKDLTVPGFKCGGKTGTANKYDPAIKGYSPDHYLASFAGLAPIDHPRIAVVVMIDDPSGGIHYGGSVSGPVFATVASQALRYLGVPGDPLPPPPPAPAAPAKKKPVVAAASIAPVAAPPSDLPDFKGLGVAKALELAREHHLDVELTGSGHVVDQEPRGPGRILLHFSDGFSPTVHK
jgi:cell division protein FtsI (penicillin-binding protein 3)